MRFRVSRRRLSYEIKNGVVQAKLLERHVVKEIVDRLWYQAKIKVWIINQPVGGKTPQNAAGIPDLMGWLPQEMVTVPVPKDEPITTFRALRAAVPLFIEVKRPGGVRRPAQIQFINEAVDGGCCALFAESWADVCRELARFGIKLREIE